MLAVADDIWPTAELLAIVVGTDSRFDLIGNIRVMIIVYFENWKCTGTSIDG